MFSALKALVNGLNMYVYASTKREGGNKDKIRDMQVVHNCKSQEVGVVACTKSEQSFTDK